MKHLSGQNGSTPRNTEVVSNGNGTIHRESNGTTHKRKSSTKAKRVDVLTELFAKHTVSDYFINYPAKPNIIIGMYRIKEKHPDVDNIRRVMGDRLLQFSRFSSIFYLNKKTNRVLCEEISKDDVDLQHHIVHLDGKGSFDDEDLSNLISKSASESWDVKKPLWKFIVVTNMKDAGSMIFSKMDHAIGDGVAILTVFRSLLDDVPVEMSFQRRRATGPSLRSSHKIINFLYGFYDGLIGWILKPADPENGLKIPGHANFGSTAKEYLRSKKFSLSTLKNMKDRLCDVSVNDIVIAVVSLGVRKYFEKTNDRILSKIDRNTNATKLNCSSVVNSREKATADETVTDLGNDFLAISYNLPLSSKTIRNELDYVWNAKAAVDFYKTSPTLKLMKATGKLLEFVRVPDLFYIKIVAEAVRKSTLVLSNLMGPSSECSLAGHVIDDMEFLLVCPVGLYVGILSYNNAFRFTFTADKAARINTLLLKECFEDAFDQLEQKILNHSDCDGGKSLKSPVVTPFSAKLLEAFIIAGIAVAVASGINSFF